MRWKPVLSLAGIIAVLGHAPVRPTIDVYSRIASEDSAFVQALPEPYTRRKALRAGKKRSDPARAASGPTPAIFCTPSRLVEALKNGLS